MITPKQFFASRLIRYAYGKHDRKRDAGQTTPPDIIRFDNILYGSDKKLKKWQLLDVYRPKAAVASDGSLQKLPVIISVHGGSFVYGDKNRYQFYCMKLAQRGFAVVNFSYRLSPEVRYFKGIFDTETVFQWVADNASQYGFDTENVFAVGDSAGGHLLGTYIGAVTNKEFGNSLGFIKDKNLTLKAIALNCGKFSLSEDEPRIKLLRRSLMENGESQETKQFLTVTSHTTKNFPPVFVMTCEGDFLKHDSELMKSTLDSIGVRNEYRCYGSSEKPLWHVFHCDPHLQEAVQCNDDECSFFRSFISVPNK